jgi:hypothetical protein
MTRQQFVTFAVGRRLHRQAERVSKVGRLDDSRRASGDRRLAGDIDVLGLEPTARSLLSD